MNHRFAPHDMQAEELRIETAAARETALNLCKDWRLVCRPSAAEAIERAVVFEKFLLAHPAAGQQALEMVHADVTIAIGSVIEILNVAIQFEAWLSGRVASEDIKPRLLLDA